MKKYTSKSSSLSSSWKLETAGYETRVVLTETQGRNGRQNEADVSESSFDANESKQNFPTPTFIFKG